VERFGKMQRVKNDEGAPGDENRVENSDSDYEQVPLNLVFDYPVKWSKFKVLRDFVQNFYDAVGWRNWDVRFSWRIAEDRLSLFARDVGFSYDWLLHIGASTKRDGGGTYAGFFGEGFKIASLCALRDHSWNVTMHSRNWELKVVTAVIEIDEQWIDMLAYNIQRSDEKTRDTALHISPFHDLNILKAVLQSFYYPGNPLFGNKIWESESASVYFRSDLQKPAGYPQTFDDKGRGIVFGAYQALGSFQYPLIFALHSFRYDDRERNTFYRMDVVKLIHEVASKLPPEASMVVLLALKNRWYDRPRKKYDFESWHRIISTLVRNISTSPEHVALWREINPYLLAARQVKRKDIDLYNRRQQALEWLRTSKTRYRLVQSAFISMGYPTVEDACGADDGFSVAHDPVVSERGYIRMLEKVALCLLSDLFSKIALPPCKIIESKNAVWQGMTVIIPRKDRSLRFRGLPVRYRLPYVALKQELLTPDAFGRALSTYLHEIAHMFGTESSAAFSNALTELMHLVVTHSEMIAECRMEWEIFSKKHLPTA